MIEQLIAEAIGRVPPAKLQAFGQDYSPYYHLMYLIAQRMNPLIAVELGVFKGRSIISLCEGSSECAVYGIDSHRQPNLPVYPNFTFIEASSTPVPAGIPSGINVLHVDTEHSYAQAAAEYWAYEPLLAPGAIVLFDDLHAAEDSVMQFFLSLQHKRIVEDALHPVCGYGVLVYA